MWLSILALFSSLASAACCIYTWSELRKRPERSELGKLLEESSSKLLESSKRSLREIETEWEEMYQKFSRLAGRMDRVKQLQAAKETPAEPTPTRTRADILRRRNHEQARPAQA